MNSDLLAQMKNKLIKLKQQTQQIEPPSLPESRPPPEQQPQPQPSSHLAQLPKNNQLQPPKTVSPQQQSQKASNQSNLRLIMSDKLLMLQQMRAKKEIEKAQAGEKKVEKQEDGKCQRGSQSQQGRRNQKQSKDEPKPELPNIKKDDQSQKQNQKGKAENDQILVYTAGKEKHPSDKDYIERKEQIVAVPEEASQQQIIPENLGEPAPERIGQDFQKVQNRIVPQLPNQEQPLVDRIDEGQNEVIGEEIIEEANERHADQIRAEEEQRSPEQIAAHSHQIVQLSAAKDIEVQNEQGQSNIHQVPRNTLKDVPVPTHLQQKQDPQVSQQQETRMSLMLQKMKLMRSQMIKQKVVQPQPALIPIPVPVGADVQLIEKAEEDEAEQQNMPEVQKEVEPVEEHEIRLSKLYRKQRKIYLKEVQNIVRMAANIKSTANLPGVAQNNQPQAVGLSKLTARLRQIVDYLIPN